jgi:signal recognition particle subunit SRP54
MTLQERRRPEIIKGSRRQRIAAGSGTSIMEVNQLIKQFGEMRKMMKSPHKMRGMMNAMGGAGGLGNMMKGMGGKFPF